MERLQDADVEDVVDAGALPAGKVDMRRRPLAPAPGIRSGVARAVLAVLPQNEELSRLMKEL